MSRDRMRSIARAALLAAALFLTAAPLGAEPRVGRPFHWTGVLKAGQKLTVHGINGVIHAERASGTEVVVDAEKHGRHDDPDKVEIGRASCRERVSISGVAVAIERREELASPLHGAESSDSEMMQRHNVGRRGSARWGPGAC